MVEGEPVSKGGWGKEREDACGAMVQCGWVRHRVNEGSGLGN